MNTEHNNESSVLPAEAGLTREERADARELRADQREVQRDKVWQRGLTMWQAVLGTGTLVMSIGGMIACGLVSIKMDVHDLTTKVSQFEKWQDRVADLERWRGSHYIENLDNVRRIDGLESREHDHVHRMETLETEQATLRARDDRQQ